MGGFGSRVVGGYLILYLVAWIAFTRVCILETNLVHHPDNMPRERQWQLSPIRTASTGPVALLVIASNRPSYLQRSLASVARYIPPHSDWPIIVSEDGDDNRVLQVIKEFEFLLPHQPIFHVHYAHSHNTDGYHRIAQHYKWALNEVFDRSSRPWSSVAAIDKVVILEEDLEIAPDFFSYFTAMAPLLDQDPSLIAASAWNDNGMVGKVQDPKLVYRSDFFPGLGWMLPRRIWDELGPKWPDAYWDDWLREAAQRRGRHFLRPEVCRTYHFGEVGSSTGQIRELYENVKFNDRPMDFWKHVQLNDKPVDFTKLNLTYLANERTYDQRLAQDLRTAHLLTLREAQAIVRDGGSSFAKAEWNNTVWKIVYNSVRTDFPEIAKSLGVFADLKDGVPRTAYKNVVALRMLGAKVYIVPQGLIL